MFLCCCSQLTAQHLHDMMTLLTIVLQTELNQGLLVRGIFHGTPLPDSCLHIFPTGYLRSWLCAKSTVDAQTVIFLDIKQLQPEPQRTCPSGFHNHAELLWLWFELKAPWSKSQSVLFMLGRGASETSLKLMCSFSGQETKDSFEEWPQSISTVKLAFFLLFTGRTTHTVQL